MISVHSIDEIRMVFTYSAGTGVIPLTLAFALQNHDDMEL